MRVEVRSSAAPRRAAWTMVALVAVGLGAVAARAQDKPALPSTTDPRASLKPGIKDAGTAAKNMALVSSMTQAARASSIRRTRPATRRRPSGRLARRLRPLRRLPPRPRCRLPPARQPLPPHRRLRVPVAASTSPTPTWRSRASTS